MRLPDIFIKKPDIFRVIKQINQKGTTVLIVEQNVKQATGSGTDRV